MTSFPRYQVSQFEFLPSPCEAHIRKQQSKQLKEKKEIHQALHQLNLNNIILKKLIEIVW